MSGATGAAGGGAAGGRQGSAQTRGQGGQHTSGGGHRGPAEQPAASTSLMPPVTDAGPGVAGAQSQGGYGYPQPPQAPPTVGAAAATPAASPAGGYSQPTTYAKGQPTPARGTRTGGTTAPRRPSGGTGAVTGGGSARTRKARLRVTKVDPWSVMKVSFLLSIALGICTIVAAAVLWMVMDAMGVFSTVGGTISEATGSNESNGFDLQSFLSLPHVLMFTTIIAVIDVVLATALATLGAFIYNLSAGFVGGVELTLAEDE